MSCASGAAGCSTGQEAYHTQMVIHDYLGPQKKQWDTVMLATDISMKALCAAREGIYDATELRNLPSLWRQTYFEPFENRFRIKEQLRRQVIFRPLNLMEPFQFKKKFHLIFCRNVMIYFDLQTKKNLVRKFYEWTAPGGYLLIGHSESLNGINSDYTYIQPAIYQKKG
jgi:chemotaxis protein methyltransferase CheR